MTQQDFDDLWMSRLWLIKTEKFLGCWDRDSFKLRNFLDVETGKFLGCQDRNSSRLGNLLDVQTKTSREWTKDVEILTVQHPLTVLCSIRRCSFNIRIGKTLLCFMGEHICMINKEIFQTFLFHVWEIFYRKFDIFIIKRLTV